MTLYLPQVLFIREVATDQVKVWVVSEQREYHWSNTPVAANIVAENKLMHKIVLSRYGFLQHTIIFIHVQLCQGSPHDLAKE